MELEERGAVAVRTAEPMPDVEAAFEEIEIDAPLVGIIMGSRNDKEKMRPAGQALQEAGIRYEVRVMSAHRDPEKVRAVVDKMNETGPVQWLAKSEEEEDVD